MNHESNRHTNLNPEDDEQDRIPSNDDESEEQSDKPFPKGDPPQRPIRAYKEPVLLKQPPKTIDFI